VSEIKRKKGESFESFMRRVKRRWQQSGKLLQAKKIQFHIPVKSKNLRHKKTVEYLQKVSKTNYLRKIGRLPEEEPTKFKKR
jgi:ribosomal protein S21